MATRQATLSETDRRGEDPGEPTRIVLTGTCTGSVFDAVRIEIAALLVDASSAVDDWDEAWGVADRIRESGSPARRATPTPGVEHIVYCYGDPCGAVSDAIETAATDPYSVEQIVIPAPSTLGETATDIADQLERLVELDADVVVSAGHRYDWYRCSDPVSLRGVVAGVRAADSWGIKLQREAIKDDVRRWCSVDKDDGRAGLGFEWVEVGDGETEWVPGDDYGKVCSILEMVRDGEMSQSQAAAELDTSARTIRRCIEDRPDRYGL